MCVGLKRFVRNSRCASREYCRHLTNYSRDGCCRTLAAAHCFPVHNGWPAGHFSAGKDRRQKDINRLTSRCSFNCTYVRSLCGDSVSWTCIFSDSWQPCRQCGRERTISRISMSYKPEEWEYWISSKNLLPVFIWRKRQQEMLSKLYGASIFYSKCMQNCRTSKAENSVWFSGGSCRTRVLSRCGFKSSQSPREQG